MIACILLTIQSAKYGIHVTGYRLGLCYQSDLVNLFKEQWIVIDKHKKNKNNFKKNNKTLKIRFGKIKRKMDAKSEAFEYNHTVTQFELMQWK